MLSVFQKFTKKFSENIAIDIIKYFENHYENYRQSAYSLSPSEYDGACKIYRYDALQKNLASVIEKTIDIDKYNQLKAKEKKDMFSIIMKAIIFLEKNSDNTVPDYSVDKYYYGRINLVQGIAMAEFASGAWGSEKEWKEMKFPDVFYQKEMQFVVEKCIANAIKDTSFKGLLINGEQKIKLEEILICNVDAKIQSSTKTTLEDTIRLFRRNLILRSPNKKDLSLATEEIKSQSLAYASITNNML